MNKHISTVNVVFMHPVYFCEGMGLVLKKKII